MTAATTTTTTTTTTSSTTTTTTRSTTIARASTPNTTTIDIALNTSDSFSSDVASSSLLRTDQIIGISVGCGVVLLLIVILTVVFICKRRSRKSRASGKNEECTVLPYPSSIDNELRETEHSDIPLRESLPGMAANGNRSMSVGSLYMDMTSNQCMVRNKPVAAPSPHKVNKHWYINTGKYRNKFNPQLEEKEDYENREAWLELEKSRSMSNIADIRGDKAIGEKLKFDMASDKDSRSYIDSTVADRKEHVGLPLYQNTCQDYNTTAQDLEVQPPAGHNRGGKAKYVNAP